MRVSKILVFSVTLLAAALLSGCTIEYKDNPNGPAYVVVEETGYDEYAYDIDVCFEEPYWHEPLWCDRYEDVECCTWYVDGWYEEWCDWDFLGCWEYYDSY